MKMSCNSCMLHWVIPTKLLWSWTNNFDAICAVHSRLTHIPYTALCTATWYYRRVIARLFRECTPIRSTVVYMCTCTYSVRWYMSTSWRKARSKARACPLVWEWALQNIFLHASYVEKAVLVDQSNLTRVQLFSNYEVLRKFWKWCLRITLILWLEIM